MHDLMCMIREQRDQPSQCMLIILINVDVPK